MVVQIKCAGNQPLSPPHARASGRERRGGGERERERIISVLYSCKSSRRKQEGLDSVYHAKNIVTLTAIYNGFRYRELLIVP